MSENISFFEHLCYSCKQPISGNPPRCPNCQALRPDIKQSKGTFYLLLIPGLLCAIKAIFHLLTPENVDKESFIGDLSGLFAFFWGFVATVLLLPALFTYLSISRRLGKYLWI